jgi:2-polyprenyl-3-methyl-5-hydroxy-6-metoxy-1,4-benzoquinol methylase
MSDSRPDETTPSTRSGAYAQRLEDLGSRRWKRWLDVQAPYRWNLRRLSPGFMLDVGCGLGRNLAHVDGNGVGVDHNEACVAAARARGFTAYTPAEFETSSDARPAHFDSLLVAHVLEHLPESAGADLLRTYLPFVKTGGRVIVITPQEAGQRSDATHVRFVDFNAARHLLADTGWEVTAERSFPLPRVAGRVFRYNEFVSVATRDLEA